MTLREAVQRFRAAIDEATTSGSVATTLVGGPPLKGATDTSNLGFLTRQGNPFYGRAGLKQIERERQARIKRKKKCKGYDPECRDAEWEVPAPVGGVALLRRSKVGE